MSVLLKLKIDEFQERFKDYSFCDIIFSALRVQFEGRELNKSDLMKLTDNDLYKALCKSYEREKIKHNKYYSK